MRKLLAPNRELRGLRLAGRAQGLQIDGGRAPVARAAVARAAVAADAQAQAGGLARRQGRPGGWRGGGRNRRPAGRGGAARAEPEPERGQARGSRRGRGPLCQRRVVVRVVVRSRRGGRLTAARLLGIHRFLVDVDIPVRVAARGQRRVGAVPARHAAEVQPQTHHRAAADSMSHRRDALRGVAATREPRRNRFTQTESDILLPGRYAASRASARSEMRQTVKF